MKKYFLVAFLAIVTLGASAQIKDEKQAEKPHLYNPLADARAEINSAVKKAKMENKNVLLQIGGNWCIWCLRFNDKVVNDAELNKLMHDNYIVVHVNYSPENKNEKVLADLGYPQRFGFPVFVILDNKGKRIHTENSSYLEEGAGHSKKKITAFFNNWSPKAINPKTYENQQ